MKPSSLQMFEEEVCLLLRYGLRIKLDKPSRINISRTSRDFISETAGVRPLEKAFVDGWNFHAS